ALCRREFPRCPPCDGNRPSALGRSGTESRSGLPRTGTRTRSKNLQHVKRGRWGGGLHSRNTIQLYFVGQFFHGIFSPAAMRRHSFRRIPPIRVAVRATLLRSYGNLPRGTHPSAKVGLDSGRLVSHGLRRGAGQRTTDPPSLDRRLFSRSLPGNECRV